MTVTAEEYIRHNPEPETRTGTELDTVLEVAENTVRAHAGGLRDLEGLSDERRALIRKAILCQADYLLANGGAD
ncbi:MAG: hypothetical protein NC237_11245, partial [Eubacterium sp.]|nr:hypothetical protein [Eubacterium sp.]